MVIKLYMNVSYGEGQGKILRAEDPLRRNLVLLGTLKLKLIEEKKDILCNYAKKICSMTLLML